MSTGRLSYLIASLLLLALVDSGKAAAAPRGEAARVVPTAIHDRARVEGDVRVLVELSLPSRRAAEGGLAGPARSAFRQEVADTTARVLSRLANHPYRVIRRYLTSPVIALQVSPAALQELDAAGLLVKRVVEDRIH